MPNRFIPNSRVRRILTGCLFAVLAPAPFLAAQEPSPAPAAPPAEAAPAGQETPAAKPAAAAVPLTVGGYTLTGGGSFGYRFVNLTGNQGKYNELFNLQEGLRLFDAQVRLDATEIGKGWFDRLALTSKGLGGDPFPVLRLDLRKIGVYDLRLFYRGTQYAYGLPQTNFTPNRGWNDRRRFADADLRYTPTRNLRFHLFYNRTERDGTDLATSPFFYVPLGPDVWEALGRFDSTPWIVPLREKSNNFGAGFDYQFGKTTIHAEQSYRTYNDPANLEGFGNQPIPVRGPASPAQNLIVQKWDTFAGFNVPTTSLRVDHELNGHLELRAGYIYSHASGPTSLNGTIAQPGSFVLNYIGAGSTNLTTNTYDAGFTLKIVEPVIFSSDYRYQAYSERGTKFIRAFRPDFPPPVTVTDDNTRWDFGFHTLETLLTVVPIGKVSIRAGVRFMKEDIVRKTNGATDRGTQRSLSYSPIISAAWTPSKKFFIRGDFDSRVVVDPYVRISPQNTVGSTIRTRYNPSDKWGIDNVWSFHNLKTDDIGFTAHSRSNSTSVWYQPIGKVEVQGGYTYGNFSSQNTLSFLSGVPPLQGLLSTDQTIDRIYSLGLRLDPNSRLTLSFNGQYIRSTGLGAVSREASTYGPLTWPACSAEIGYTTKNFGRVIFGWQRSYYHEDLFRAADYSATSFTLRFERTF
jgi:hypothetical protein